jgi:hypothetical protein
MQRESERRIGYVLFVLPLEGWQVYVEAEIRFTPSTDALSLSNGPQLITQSTILLILITIPETTGIRIGLYLPL